MRLVVIAVLEFASLRVLDLRHACRKMRIHKCVGVVITVLDFALRVLDLRHAFNFALRVLDLRHAFNVL